MHFIQGQSNYDSVEKDLINSLDTFFEGNLFFELFHVLLFGWFYNFPVDPVLDAGVFATECHKEAVEVGELLLLVFFLCKGEHWFGHCTDD